MFFPPETQAKTIKMSSVYQFSRRSSGITTDATTLYSWICIANVQIYSGPHCPILSESASLSFWVFCIMLVYGMSLLNKKLVLQVIT
jgi:hypothetical protein